MLFERRLVIEQVDVAGGAGHEQLDDPLRFRWMMLNAGYGGAVEQSGQGDAAREAPPPERQRKSRRESMSPQSTNTNSFRLKITRHVAGKPCFSAYAVRSARSASVGGRAKRRAGMRRLHARTASPDRIDSNRAAKLPAHRHHERRCSSARSCLRRDRCLRCVGRPIRTGRHSQARRGTAAAATGR